MDTTLSINEGRLAAIIDGPQDPRGVVLFAHGSGSSRLSPRNQHVAKQLVDAGFTTVLLDLLTPEEEATDEVSGLLRFDIRLLSTRLIEAVDWVSQSAELGGIPLGLFGASTGAAAALNAAAERPEAIRAIVSRGGRPDLAEPALPLVRAATLLIVGGQDEVVIKLSEGAAEQLHAEMIVIPGASHLFTEPGALDEVARHATAWFTRHLVAGQ